MNLSIVLGLLVVCASSSVGAAKSSAPNISLIVKIYRTTGANTQLQQFNISLSDFDSILQKLSGSLKSSNNSQLATQLSDYVKQLQIVIPKIIKNTTDQESITSLSANLLQLINGLSTANSPELSNYLKLIETSFQARKAPVVYSKAHLRRVCRKRKAGNSSKTTITATTVPRQIIVRVNVTAKTQVQNLNRTLTALVRTHKNPAVVTVLNRLIITLTSYTRTRDPSRLIQLIQAALQLSRQHPNDQRLSGVSSNLASLVSSLLGSSRSISRSSPLSQLIAFLTGLTRNNLLSVDQSDKILNTLAKNGVNDGNSLLQTLIGIVRPLSPRIPSRINGTSQNFLRELFRLPSDQSQGAIERLLKSLQSLVNDVSRYNGSDRDAVTDVVRLIITVLLSVLGENQYATGILQQLLPSLNPQTASLRARLTPRQCGQASRGGLDLSSIVCNVENVLVGRNNQPSLVGTVQNLLGGVLGANSGQRLLGGNPGRQSFQGGNPNLGLLRGIIGGNRGLPAYGGNNNYGDQNFAYYG